MKGFLERDLATVETLAAHQIDGAMKGEVMAHYTLWRCAKTRASLLAVASRHGLDLQGAATPARSSQTTNLKGVTTCQT